MSSSTDAIVVPVPAESVWGENAMMVRTLVYRESAGSDCKNLLLIDTAVVDSMTLFKSANALTFPVAYNSVSTSRAELLDFLQSNLTTVERVGLCFASNDQAADATLFLENANFFDSDNIGWMAFILNEFQVANVDYFGCSTLQSQEWLDYYAQIGALTSAVVGASSDKTGNIKYGGDWVMESTCEDIEFVYFTENIEYYKYLLDTAFCRYFAVAGPNNCYGFSLQDKSNYGNGTAAITYPVLVNTLPSGKTVSSFSATGTGGVFAVMTDGTLYGIGNNSFGELGIALNALTATAVASFQLITLPGSRLVNMITCGAYNLHVLTTDGKVYTCGRMNMTHGNTTVQSTTTSTITTRYTFVEMMLPTGKTPSYINAQTDGRISLVMTDGTVYYCGDYRFSTADSPSTILPAVAPGTSDLVFKYFEAWQYAIGITTSNEIYWWNNNSTAVRTKLTVGTGKIPAIAKVSAFNCLVVCTDGTTYGLGTSVSPTPSTESNYSSIATQLVKLPAITGKTIINARLREDQYGTIALTKDGLVYASGRNWNYLLGNGGTADSYGAWVQCKTNASTPITGITNISTNQPNLVITVPSVPVITSIVPSSGTLTVYFTASDGGSNAISDYKYSINGGNTYVSTGLTTSPITISSLTNNRAYNVILVAVNAIGTSADSTTMSGTPAVQPPASPTITSITAGNGQLSVSFTAGSNNGSAITDYKYSTDGGSTYSSAVTATSPVIINGLTNGTTYTVYLKAVNAGGDSAASSSMSGMPVSVPVSPTVNSITAGDGQLTVYFTIGGNNGSAITDCLYSKDGTNYTSIGASPSSPLTISGLTNGTSYPITFKATNAIGTSAASSSVAGIPAGIPYSPTITGITAGDGQLSVVFTAGSNNGRAITGYTYSLNGGSDVSVSSTTSPIVITGLINGTSYTVALKAVTSIGTSSASSGVSAIPAGVPISPGIDSIAYGDGQLTVNFTARSSNGRAITNYKYALNDGTYISVGSTSSPFTIPNLTNGTSYTVTLKAVNDMGDSSASSGVSGIPAGVPFSPTITGVTSGDSQLSVAFTAGGSNGRAITNYKYSLNGGQDVSANSTTSPIVIPGLSNGTSYTVVLKAVSVVGDSSASSGVSGIPYGYPYAPTIDGITVGNTQLSVAFTAAYNNGSAITNYKYSVNGGAYVSAGTTTSPIVIADLSNGTSYAVSLKAVNSKGDSVSGSGSVSATPVSAPDKPTINSITIGDKQLSVYFTAGFNNGRTITNYKYSLNGGQDVSANSTTSPIVIPGLSNGTSYTVVLKAINDIGTSPASSSASEIPAGWPFSPTIDSITSGNEQLTVRFTSGYSNGRAITNYKYSLNGGQDVSANSTTSPIVIPGLSNGTSYTVTLKAVSTIGDSSASSGVTAIPYTNPGAPRGLTAVAGNKRVVLTFTDGSANGSALTDYKYSLDGGASYTSVAYASFTSPYTISGLTAGDTYTLLLRDVNIAGDSLDASCTFVPYDVPSQPQILSVNLNNGETELEFTSSPNGLPLTNVSYIINGGGYNNKRVSVGSPASPFSLSGLANGNSYRVEVITTNSAGDSVASNPAIIMAAIPLPPPGAPTITSVTASDRALSVAFTPGDNTGGSPILAYQYSIDNGATYHNAVETASPLTIPGLTNGTQYTVKLKAVSGAGTSSASNSMTGKPVSIPDSPRITGVSSGDGELTVSFTEGDSNGSDITGYYYSFDDASYTSVDDVSGNSTFSISSSVVSVGSSYTIYLKSLNDVGYSVNPIPFGPTKVYVTPLAPTLGAVSVGDESISVAFTQTSNGYPVLRYEYAIEGGVWSELSAYSASSTLASPFVFAGMIDGSAFARLSNGTSYTIYVRTVTAVGTSDPTSVSDVVPLASTLPAPVITGVVPDDSSLLVSYVLGNTNGDGYSMLYSLNDGEFVVADSASNPLVIDGLTNATPYSVTLKVQNGTITSSASATSSAFKPGKDPSAPTINSVTANLNNAEIDFTDGDYYNAPLIGYKYSKDAGSTYKWANSTETPLVIYDITPGATYQFMMQAVTEYAVSGVSNQVSATMASLSLNPPTIVSAVASDGAIEVSFIDGLPSGLTVTGYKYSIDNGATYQSVESVSYDGIFTIASGLTNGTSYQVAMKSVADDVESSKSNTISAKPTRVPDAPTITGVVAGNKSVSISFANGNLYGYEILGYKYSLDDGANYYIAPWTSSPIVLMGLTNGESYTVRLKAFTAIGESDGSTASDSFVPFAVPLPPVIVGATIGHQSVSLQIVDGDANGLSITGYSYSFDGTSYTAFSGVSKPLDISGLTNGQSYTVRVKATTTAGTSIASNSVVFVPASKPAPPVITQVVAGDKSASIEFTDGSLNGGTVIGYKYSLDGGANYYIAPGTSSPIVLTGLTNGQSYTVRLKVFTQIDTSDASEASSSFAPFSPPLPPAIVGATIGHQSVSLQIVDGDANGLSITGYSYSFDGTSYTAFSGVSKPLVISGLTNGQSYTVRVKATTTAGTSIASNSVVFVPASKPAPPVITQVVAGDKSASIEFTDGSLNGGTVIGYKYSLDGGANYYIAPGRPSSPIVLTGLTNGESYTVRLKVFTQIDTSDASEASSSFAPFSPPLPPAIVSATIGHQSVSLQIVDGDTNGLSITGYSYSFDGTSYTAFSGASKPLVISGLTNGQSYTVRVKATTTAGTSIASNSVVFVPASKPAPPVITQVVAGDKSASIEFTDGSLNGGTVIGYKYSLDGGANYYTAPGRPSSPIVLTGLTNGESYTVRLKVFTQIDTSDASEASSAFVPFAAPLPPAIVGATAGDQSVSLQIVDGDSKGFDITEYSYSLDGSSYTAFSGVSKPLAISGLTNGQSYTVRVKAKTDVGTSGASNIVSFMPVTVPEPPTITQVVVGDKSASIEFTDGELNGGTVIGYKYSLDDGANYYTAPGVPASPIVLTGLTNGESYTVRLKAFTEVGASEDSVASEPFTPSAAPLPPVITGVSVGHQTVSIQIYDGDSNGFDITEYSYSFDGSSYTAFSGLSKPLTISGLTNGQSYAVRVKAKTDAGTSRASNIVTFVPASRPEPATVSQVVAGDKSVSIEFTDGSLNGGSLSGYMYSLNDSTDLLWTAGKTSPLTIRGLSNATSYTFKLYTVSNMGISDACDISGSYTPVGVPGRPSVASLTAGDQQITVTVTNGASNGRPITSYKYSFDGHSYTTVEPNPFTISGLTNGNEYSLYVICTNEAGDSPASLLSDVVVPYGAPGAATILSVASANRALRVVVSTDNMNGCNPVNCPLLGYKYSFDGTDYDYQIDTSSNQFTTAAVLTNGVPTQVYVKRITSFGYSEASNASELTTPCNVPDAPTITSILSRDQMGIVAFTDGSANGSPITGYKYSFDGVKYVTALQTSSPISLYNLINGTSYTVRLKTFSNAGDSEPYMASTAIVPYSVPFAPVITKIEPGDKCAYVYFNPINNNGSAITLIRYSIGGSYLDASGTTSPIVVPNLNNGGIVSGKTSSPYSIYIAAVNTAGISVASNTLTIIPGVPLAPVVTNLVSGPDSFRIEFTPPASENGSPVTAYFVNYAGLKDPLKLVGLTSPLIVPNLTNGTSYAPVIYAINKVGRSINSNAFGSVMPCKAPNKISVINATAYYQYTQVDFAVPNSNGAAITKYVYSLVGDTTSPWYDASGLSSPIILYNTPVNVAFTVKLAAVNALGTAEPAVTAKATRFTFTAPATIKTPTVTIGLGSMTVALIPPATVGSNITKYSYSLNSGPYRDFSGLTPPFTIDISNNVDYTIQVTATNLAGTSVPSAPMAKPVRYVYLPPSAGPAITSVLPIVNGVNVTSGTAVVTFTPPAPAAIRNAPITGYAYTLDSSAGTPISLGASPATITGISNMVPHTLYVYAVTAIGMSVPTASKPFTISYGVPSAPVIKSATLVSQDSSMATFRLAVTPPAVLNGSAVSKYYYSFDSGATYSDVGAFSTVGTDASMTITTVPNDVSTNIVIAAENMAGRSPRSVLSVIVNAPYRAPSAPTIGVPTSTTNSITVPFTASLPNGSPITDYLISLNGATATSAGLTTPITVNGLSGKTAYSVILYAVNGLGTSAASKAVSITTK